MALKYELEQWGAAVEAYDNQDYEKALDTFESIADSAKFFFNMGLIFATLGDHEEACKYYKKALKLDVYLAIAYFQKGVSHFLISQFDAALSCFNDSLQYLRGNMLIDYEQLGLKFRLYSCEVLFNRGLCYLYIGKTGLGMDDFAYAAKEKQTEDHDIIDEAIAVQGQGFTVFSIPVGVIYRPPEGKLKNVKTKDYLGKAILVAAVDPDDAYTGFSGAQKKQIAQSNTTTPITKDKTDGKVAQIKSSEDDDDEFVRPRSLSTNPKQAPFPIRTAPGRNPSLRRGRRSPADPDSSGPQDIRNTPTQQYGDLGNGDDAGLQIVIPPLAIPDKKTRLPQTQGYSNSAAAPLPNSNLRGNSPVNNPVVSPIHRTATARRPADLRIHHRSNTIDSGRPSPKFPPALQRQNSLRMEENQNPQEAKVQRSNSLRTPQRSSSIRDKSLSPKRSNTQVRTQFLQKQIQAQQTNMSKMTLADETNGYAGKYYDDSDPYGNNGTNDGYEFMGGGEINSEASSVYNSPILGSDKNFRRATPSRSQSLRGRISPGNRGLGSNLQPSPLRALTPTTSEQGEQSYASLIFGKDDEDGYGDYDDTEFEIVSPPSKSDKAEPLKREPPKKIKIKCHHKDTRVILVPATIIFSELSQRIQEKFGSPKPFKLRYKDEDGVMILMTDQEDIEMVISIISNVSGEIGRTELWLEDL